MKVVDVIKYEGNNDNLVWRFPGEDFNTLSQLVVHETQEAILFKNGQALDLFGPGRHTLKTANIPLLQKLVNLPFNGTSPFHCEVYFINKTNVLNILWGTKSPIDVIDPEFELPIQVGASGALDLQVYDSRKLLVKIVGTEACLGAKQFVSYFKNQISMLAKTKLATLIKTFGYFALAEHLEDLSASIGESLVEDFAAYGMQLINFMVSSFGAQEDDFVKLKEVRERKLEYRELGYNWMDERIAEVTQTYAANPVSANNIGSMVAQMPLAFAFGNVLAQESEPLLQSVAGGFSHAPQAFANKLNNSGVADAKDNEWKPSFAVTVKEKEITAAQQDGLECKIDSQVNDDPVAILGKLKELLQADLISQDAYDVKVSEVLGRM